MNLKALSLSLLAVIPMMATPVQAYSSASSIQAAANKANWGGGKTVTISHLGQCKWDYEHEYVSQDVTNNVARLKREAERLHRVYMDAFTSGRDRDYVAQLRQEWYDALARVESAGRAPIRDTNRKRSVTCTYGYVTVKSPMGTTPCQVQSLTYNYRTNKFSGDFGLCNHM